MRLSVLTSSLVSSVVSRSAAALRFLASLRSRSNSSFEGGGPALAMIAASSMSCCCKRAACRSFSVRTGA